MFSTKRKIPGEDLPLLLSVVCLFWTLPIALWWSMFRKIINLFYFKNFLENDEIENALVAWNFEKKSIPGSKYYFRSSSILNSSKGPSIVILVIGPSLYCQASGFNPTENLRLILCSLLEELSNASLIIISSEWVNPKSTLDLNELIPVHIENSAKVYKYAIDYELQTKFNINTINPEAIKNFPCRLCLPGAPSSLSSVSIREIFAILNSITIRVTTSGWPYKCALRSNLQLRTQLLLELGKGSSACFDLILEIILRQMDLMKESFLALKLLGVWCIKSLLNPIL